MKLLSKRNIDFWIRSQNKIRNKPIKKKRKRSFKYDNFVKISAPKEFYLGADPQRTELLTMLKSIRYHVFTLKKSVLIDFRDTRRMIADGTLLFYAEIVRMVKEMGDGVKIRCLLPSNSGNTSLINDKNKERQKVAQVLKQIGILDVLRNNSPIKPVFEDVIYWRSAHGYKSEGGKTEPILSVIDNLLGEKISKKLYTGLAEAMTNSFHHAYEGTREDGLNIDKNSGWWMFLQVREGRLSLFVCDLGIGIPRSLPSNNGFWLHDLVSIAPEIRESMAIKFAAEHGSTSTNLSNRGKGLKKMLKIVEDIPGSNLRIYSNKGKFDVGSTIELVQKDYPMSIMGTMIIWNVDIKEHHESN